MSWVNVGDTFYVSGYGFPVYVYKKRSFSVPRRAGIKLDIIQGFSSLVSY